MKRRKFLKISSAGLVAAIAPDWVRSQSIPCPPPSIDLSGAGSATTSCGSAEADWIARSTGPGVVWAHDFRYKAELDAFNDRGATGTAAWNTTDGFGNGKCIDMVIPAGGQAVGSWWRPFSRIAAGNNGLPNDDPGANGTVPLRNDWTFTAGVDSSNPGSSWQGGIYCNNAYNPNFGGQSVLNPALGANMFDGSDFYIQLRVKIPAVRWTDSINNSIDGKLFFVSSMRKSNPNQELVIQSQGIWPWDPATPATTNIYRMYTNNGNQFNSFLTSDNVGGTGSNIQPGGLYPQCTIGNGTNAKGWYWPKDQWVTLLIHVTPGHQVVDTNTNTFTTSAANSGCRDTGIQVFTDWNSDTKQRQTTYLKIWDKPNYVWQFGGANSAAYPDDSAEGFSGLILSGFMNAGAQGANAGAGWYQRFTQVIFSKQSIPCPLA